MVSIRKIRTVKAGVKLSDRLLMVYVIVNFRALHIIIWVKLSESLSMSHGLRTVKFTHRKTKKQGHKYTLLH